MLGFFTWLFIVLIYQQETKAIDDLAAYVTSITAQPQFTSAVAALEAAIPKSVISELEEAPESYILALATGTEPAYLAALPTGVLDYVASVGEQALSILEQDTGLSAVPAGLIPTAVAPALASAYPTGGYYGTGYPYPSGYATGATGASGSGGLQPTQNLTTFNGGNAGPSPAPFLGAAAPRKSAFGVAALIAGAAILFVC